MNIASSKEKCCSDDTCNKLNNYRFYDWFSRKFKHGFYSEEEINLIKKGFFEQYEYINYCKYKDYCIFKCELKTDKDINVESEIEFRIRESYTNNFTDEYVYISYQKDCDYPTIGVTGGHEYCEIQLVSEDKINQVIKGLEACKKELKRRENDKR